MGTTVLDFTRNDIRSMLEYGDVVLDRYSCSGIAYSVAQGLDYTWCCNTEIGLLEPDITIFLDIDPVVASQRSEYGKEVYERLDMQTRVRQAFKQMKGLVSIDATQSVEDIHAQIASQVAKARQDLSKDLQTISGFW
jgi:dTMP kinase